MQKLGTSMFPSRFHLLTIPTLTMLPLSTEPWDVLIKRLPQLTQQNQASVSVNLLSIRTLQMLPFSTKPWGISEEETSKTQRLKNQG